MFGKKEYKSTSKINYAFMKANAMSDLAERYVKNDNHKRAVRCTIDFETLRVKAWDTVFELYPFLKGKKLTHKLQDKVIVVNKDTK